MILISYSHNDTELCHRIFDVLEKDQLHVWIDSRLMHGATSSYRDLFFWDLLRFIEIF
jgi:hypothetical protein